MRRIKLSLWLLFASVFAGFTTPALASELPAQVEADAIAMTNAALSSDQQHLQRVYRKALSEVRSLHRTLADKPFDERHAREVSQAFAWLKLVSINQKNGSMIGAAIAANQLSAEMIRFQHSGSKKSWDAHWLGYLGRELMLLTMEGANLNAELLESRRNDAISTWQRLRLEIIKNFRDKPLVEEGDALFRQIGMDSTSDKLIRQGRQLAAFAEKLSAQLEG